MAKNKQPARPYYPVKHEHADSLAAYEQAATMLYNAVTLAINYGEGNKVLEALREPSEAFRKAAYGDE